MGEGSKEEIKDEPRDEPRAEAKEKAKEEAKKPSLIDGAPMGFIRGVGTPTSPSERHYHELFEDAEVRRDEADRDLRDAQKGDGRLYVNQMTGHPEIPKAYVLLKYLTRGGEETNYACLADIIIGINPERPDEIALQLVCPRCAEGQKHLQDCQMMIRQSRKHLKLVPAKGSPTFEFEGEIYNSAGMITESERCKCPECGWAFRIDHNRVWPD